MNDLSQARLDRASSLRDRALDVLRQAIVAGQIQVGELCSVSALARELGVSASPVREAMLTLVNEGVMEPVRNRGFRIVEVGDHDLDEIVELRLMLEVPAVTCLAHQDISAAMPNLEALVTATEDAAADRDVNAFLARDRDFHLALLKLHDNQRLVNWVALLRDQTRLYGLTELAHRGLLKGAAAEHRHLLEALALRDERLVRERISSHLHHIRRDWANGSSPSVRIQRSHAAAPHVEVLTRES